MVRCALFILLVAALAYGSALSDASPDIGVAADFDPVELRNRGIYDFITAASMGRTIGEMVLDIEGAPARAYDVLEYAVSTAAYAIRPQDDEITALRKVDAILFEHMRFKRGAPGTTFSDGLTNGVLDCSDASLVFISAARRAGRDWFTAMAPFHMFVVARDGAGYIFWETQEGCTFEVADMVAFHGVRRELIDEGVYLNEMSIRDHVAEAYRNIGGILVRQGEPDNAVNFLERSLWLRPSYPPTLIWRGHAFGLMGLYDAAERDFLAVLEIDRFDWVANYHLAVLYSETGDDSESAKYLELSERYRPANARWVLDEALPQLSGGE